MGERESGTLKLRLGLPATKRDVLLAELVSRLSLVVVTLLPLFVVLGVLMSSVYGGIPLVAFGLTAGWLLFYTSVWTTFVVGVSAAFTSPFRVLAAICGTYLFFSPVTRIWDMVVMCLFSLVFAGSLTIPSLNAAATGNSPAWFLYVEWLNPIHTLIWVGEWITSLKDTAVPMGELSLLFFSIGALVILGGGALFVGYVRFQRVDL
ncbi:hypothetical protein ELS19_18535 [Halogeometricum borinquense]|uniref:Uncharacterized protein n=1 Tax=Halogeometricum borinquense TaxID=60847 RepID=A0A482T7Z4_9EURY|nr:hypothetical protein ELS19_18535 [Halogeometricum borinquense]